MSWQKKWLMFVVIWTASCGPSGGPQSPTPGSKLAGTDAPGVELVVLSPEEQQLKAANAPFSMLGGGPRHCHRADVPGPREMPASHKTFRCGARVFASPVIGPDGTVYVGSIDGTFNALRLDGTLRWSYVCGEPIFSTAAVSGMGMVYVGCDNDEFLAFSTDGTPRFSYPMKQDVDSAPVVAPGGSVFVGGDGLHILTPSGGRIAKIWLGGHVSASPSVRPDGAVIVGSHDHRLYAVLEDGTVDWSFDTSGPIESPAAILNNNDAVFGSDDGYVYRLNALGEIRWKFKAGGPVKSGIAVSKTEETLYVTSMDGSVYGIDASSGKKLWQITTASKIRASPMLDSAGTLYVGSRDHHLYAIDAALGELIYRVDLKAEIDSTVAITADRTLVVGSDDGRVHILGGAK